MKKKYNPFKLWGSYVGAVIPIAWFIWISQKCTVSCDKYGLMLPGVVVAAILGFLIGWLIHSLVRKSK